MGESARVHVVGPLATHVTRFAAALSSRGYTALSIRNLLGLMAHLSRWMEQRAVAAAQVTDFVVEHFVAERRCTHTAFRTSRALIPLLEYLRSVGVVAAVAPAEQPTDRVLYVYQASLLDERGLKLRCVREYVAVASELLADRDPAELVAGDVTKHVQVHVGEPSLRARLTALRSVLRFLFLRGETPIDLTYAVPSVSHRRQAALPKGLEHAERAAMLTTCDRRTTMGRRDYAALMLMVRLGLRACEVAALTLDDVDWEAGEITVRGKGATGRLPLPTDVGDAVVSYLRRRSRQAQTRHVFLRCKAPHRGGSAGMFTVLAARALRAAGIASGGSHRLRHTAATQMLRHGASLTEIAQVLRHRHIDTTAIYAKVARDELRSIAQPWPTGHALETDTLRTLVQPWPGGAA